VTLTKVGLLLTCPTFHTSYSFPAKAHYRRGLAYLSTGYEEKAEVDLASAAQLAPNDANIAAELNKIRQAKKDLKEKEKKAYKKLFTN
jgi:peptidyl-prolyl isomerase D